MALHELGTNAVKYGALSNDAGTIDIEWAVRRGEEITLLLRWRESGGPPVKKPTRTGFGSRLIERSLARELAGEVNLSYEPGASSAPSRRRSRRRVCWSARRWPRRPASPPAARRVRGQLYGSAASRRPSPTKLKAKTVTRTGTTGRSSHG